jgi:hypothetical protein
MFKARLNAQVFLEFVLSFFCMLLFIVLTTVVFVWFSNHLVNRHVKFEDTRVHAGNITTAMTNINFYCQTDKKLDVFEDF